MKKTFTYKDEKSDKFWTIETNGAEFTVTFGKAGTAGQTSNKTFADEAACTKEAEKLIKEKTKKGYTEDGASAQTAPAQETPAKEKTKSTKTAAVPQEDNRTDLEKEVDEYIMKLVRKTSKRSDWVDYNDGEIIFEVKNGGTIYLEIGDYSLDLGDNAFWEFLAWYQLEKKSSANYQELTKASLLRLNAAGQLKPLLKAANTIIISTDDLPQLAVLTTDDALKKYLPAKEAVLKKDNEKKPLERFLDTAFPKRIGKTPNEYEALRIKCINGEISPKEFGSQVEKIKTHDDNNRFSELRNTHYKKLQDLMFTDKESYFPIFRKFIETETESHTSDTFFLLREMALDKEDYGKKPRHGKMTPIEFLKQTGLANFYVTELYFFQDMSLACADWLNDNKAPKPLQTFKAVSDAFPGIFKEYMKTKGLPSKDGLIMSEEDKKGYIAMLINYFEPSKENEEVLSKYMMADFMKHVGGAPEKLAEMLKDKTITDALAKAGINETFNNVTKGYKYDMNHGRFLDLIASVLVTSEFKNEKARVLYSIMARTMDLEDSWNDPYDTVLKTFFNWRIKGSVKEDNYHPPKPRVASVKKFLDLGNPDAASGIAELMDFAEAKQRREDQYKRKDKEIKGIFNDKIAAIEKDKALLFDFLSVLADTPAVKEETLEVLKVICSKTEKAEVEKSSSGGNYMSVTLSKGIKLEISAPECINYDNVIYEPHVLPYMDGHMDCFSNIHGGMTFFNRWSWLEIEGKVMKRLGLERVICSCSNNNGNWLVHPTEKNTSGNPKLCYLVKSEQRFSYESDCNAGTLFINMFAESLGIEVKAYKTEIVETKKKKQEKPKANYTVNNQFAFSLKPSKYKGDIEEVYDVVKNELEEMANNNEKISGFALATHDMPDESCYLQGFDMVDGEIDEELFLEDFCFSNTKEDREDYQEQITEKFHVMAWALMKLQKEGAFDPVIKSFPFPVALDMHDVGEEECFVLEEK